MSPEHNPYEHVLVSLDGSDFAEMALGPAAAVARGAGAVMHLMAVPEVYGIDTAWYAEATSPGSALSLPLQEMMDEAQDATERYLQERADEQSRRGLKVETHIAEQEPGEAILATADQVNADLIVMATHGRGGVTRWAFGSVAEHVLRLAQVPLLLVRIDPRRAANAFRNIMVLLDGSDRAERILADAVPLAKSLDARLILVNVTREPDSMPAPSALFERQREHVEAMRTYLGEKVAEVEAAGIEAVGEELSGPSVAEAILQREERGDIDLLAMTTHGRTGLKRVAFGSVADRVIRNGMVPVLLRRTV